MKNSTVPYFLPRKIATHSLLLLAVIASLLFSMQRGYTQDKVEVLLDWFINPDHAPLIIAKVDGYFAKEDLNVTLIPPTDPSLPPRLVAAKKSDVAISYQPQLHLFADKQLPIKRFGTLVATPLNSLVVLENSGIESIADLDGKNVGFSVGGFEEAILSTMLEKHGLGIDDIQLINVNFALSGSLYTGDVDAVIGAFRNFELNQMMLDEKPGKAFFVEEEGVPFYDELILIAHSEHLSDSAFQDKMRRFLRAIELATVAMMNRPDALWEKFIAYDTALDTPLNQLAWKDTLRRFALRPSVYDAKRYKKFAQYLQNKGIIKDTPPLSRYVIDLHADDASH